MFTAVAETSLMAYRQIRTDGTLSRRQAQVMDAIKAGRDYSLQEICRITGLPANVVSARVNELKAMVKLVHSRKRKCLVTGRTIHPVRLFAVQLEMFS